MYENELRRLRENHETDIFSRDMKIKQLVSELERVTAALESSKQKSKTSQKEKILLISTELEKTNKIMKENLMEIERIKKETAAKDLTLQERDSEIRRLVSNLSEMQRIVKIYEMEGMNKKQNNNIDSSSESSFLISEAIGKLTTELDKVTNEKITLEASLREAAVELAASREALNSQTLLIRNFEKNEVSLKRELENLKANEAPHIKNDVLKVVNHYEEERKNIMAELEQLKANLNSTEQRANENLMKKKEYEQRLLQMAAQAENTNRILRATEEEMAKLRERIDLREIRKDSDLKMITQVSLDGPLASREEVNKKAYAGELEDLNRKLRIYEEERRALKEENFNLISSNEQQQQRLLLLTSELEKTSQALRETQNELANASFKLADNNSQQLAEFEKKFKITCLEIEKANILIREKQEELDRHRLLLNEKELEIRMLKERSKQESASATQWERFEEYESKILSLNKEIERLRIEQGQSSNDRLEELSKQNIMLYEDNQKLFAALKDKSEASIDDGGGRVFLLQRLSALEQENNILKEEITKLRKLDKAGAYNNVGGLEAKLLAVADELERVNFLLTDTQREREEWKGKYMSVIGQPGFSHLTDELDAYKLELTRKQTTIEAKETEIAEYKERLGKKTYNFFLKRKK